jgi:ketosteroid isomerase-like protein
MNANEKLINQFYTSFNNKDYGGMQQCYTEDIHFSDPAFNDLYKKEPGAMWHLLLSRSKDLKVEFNNIKANDTEGSCNWIATYTLTTTGRKVINRVEAKFQFKDGKIIRHADHFDFYKWAKQGFGPVGYILGWTPILKNKVTKTARENLKNFIAKNPQYQ